MADPTDMIRQMLAMSGQPKLPVPEGTGDFRDKLIRVIEDLKRAPSQPNFAPGLMPGIVPEQKFQPSQDQPKPFAPMAELPVPKVQPEAAFDLDTSLASITKKKQEDEAQKKAREALEQARAGLAAKAAQAAQAAGAAQSGVVPDARLPSEPHQFEGQHTVDPNATGFEAALHRTLTHEGGYNARDANGYPVNMGINAEFHPGVDVKNLTKAQATQIYRKQYWDAINGDSLPPNIQALAFDTAVISGVARAKQFLAQSGGDPAKFLELRRQYEEGLATGNPQKYKRYANTWAGRRASYMPLSKPAPDTRARGGPIHDLLATARNYR